MKTKWPAIGLACVLSASVGLLATEASAYPGPQQVNHSSDGTPSAAHSNTTTAPMHGPAVVRSNFARISRVLVALQDQSPSVRIEGEGDFHYRTSRVENPSRLVLDFVDTTISATATPIQVGAPLIHSVRVAQFQPDVARVVVELNHWTTYQVLASAHGVVVVFDGSVNDVAVQSASHHVVLPSTSIRRPLVKARRQSPLNAPGQYPLPSWLTGTTFALASQSQPMAPPPAQRQNIAPQAMNNVSGPSAGVAPQTSPRFTGEPIRVNLKDADLQDFFRLIHEISGLNVVLDPAVKGQITLVMDDVPWDQVLDIVLKNNGLDKQLDGNVLRIATQATLKSEAETRTALLQAQQESVEPITVTYRLSYAKASQQGAQAAGGKVPQGKGMDELIKPFLSKRGNVFGDSRTNTLIVRDIPSVIPKIEELIHQLDRKSQQVEIEARVVLASRSFAQDLGTQFGFQSTAGNSLIGGLQSLLTGTTSSSGTGGTGTTPTGPGTFTVPLNTNLPAIGPTSGILYTFKSTNFALDFAITAMESKGVGKLISSPKVVTQNNAEGTVQQGEQIPIQTNINNTISTQYINAVLQLKVTPQITADGTIFMIVHLENTQIDSGVPAILGQPALATQSVDNSVIARDGETIMLGGVMVNSQANTVNEVPLIGSVPLIGNLFKRRQVKVNTQQLFFFLTPRVSQD